MGLRRKASQAGEALFSAGQVDLVALVDDTVELHIVVDVPWTGSDRQLVSLQEKVHNYIGYASDGQLVGDYPQTQGLPWRIVVNCRTGPPDSRSAETLRLLQERVPLHGGELAVQAQS